MIIWKDPTWRERDERWRRRLRDIAADDAGDVDAALARTLLTVLRVAASEADAMRAIVLAERMWSQHYGETPP